MKRLLLLLPMLLCLLASHAAQCQSMDEIKNASYFMPVMVSGALCVYTNPSTDAERTLNKSIAITP